MSWMDEGQEAVADAYDQQRRDQDARRKMDEFWMNPASNNDAGEAQVVFIDQSQFHFKRHEMEVGGRFINFTCLTGVDSRGCPGCQAGDRPVDLYPRTLIDTREIVYKRSGKVAQFRKLIWPAKQRAHESLIRAERRELDGVARGPFSFTRIRLSRGDKQISRCGVYAEYEGKLSPPSAFFADLGNKGIKEPRTPRFVPVTENTSVTERTVLLKPATFRPIVSLDDYRIGGILHGRTPDEVTAFIDAVLAGGVPEEAVAPNGYWLRYPDENEEALPITPWALDYRACFYPRPYEEIVAELDEEVEPQSGSPAPQTTSYERSASAPSPFGGGRF